MLATLGITPDSSDGPSSAAEGTNDKTRDAFTWEPADRDDPVAPLPTRLLHAIAERHRWRTAYERARDGLPPPTDDSSATDNTPASAA